MPSLRITFSVLTILAAVQAAARAEVTAVQLPEDYSDFARDPETGTIAALAADKNEVVFYLRQQLGASSERLTPAARTRLGGTPAAIAYKRYQQLRVFVVACPHESRLYLVSAEGHLGQGHAPFRVLNHVDLEHSGAAQIGVSANDRDPFVYCSFGSGSNLGTVVVSLGDMRAHGPVFGPSDDCALSAGGDVVFRRNSTATDGFEALIRTSSLADPIPRFATWLRVPRPAKPFFPDPFDRLTASGREIFSRNLLRREAQLSFDPLCFFSTRPLIVGNSAAPEIVLQAASYNTLKNIGQPVRIPKEPEAKPRFPGGPATGRNRPWHGQDRLFADDARAEVVHAERDWLRFVPLADFGLPEEPLLIARLDGPRELIVGRREKWKLIPVTNSTQITFDSVPAGAEISGNTLTWRPDHDQVGPATIRATASAGNHTLPLQFDLQVRVPNIRLPFAPVHFTLAPSGTLAAIWEGDLSAVRIPPQRISHPNLAVVNLRTGKAVRRQLEGTIHRCVVTEGHVVVLPGDPSVRCDVFRTGDLRRVAGVAVQEPIRQVGLGDKLLLVGTASTIELFDTNSFQRIRSFPTDGDPTRSLMSEHGIVLQGVLFGFDLKPRLILQPGPLLTLGDSPDPDDPDVFPSWFTSAPATAPQPPEELDRGTRIANVTIPGTSIQVTLDRLTTQQFVNVGPSSFLRNDVELALSFTEPIARRLLVVRDATFTGTDSVSSSASSLQLTKDYLYVTHGDRLHRLRIPRSMEPDAESSEELLVWNPQSSVLALPTSGKTELRHEVRGGKLPLRLRSPLEGLQVDESTGTVLVDNRTVMNAARNELVQHMRAGGSPETSRETLGDMRERVSVHAAHALGRAPTGIPVAVPIRLSISDPDRRTHNLAYFVLAEVPSAGLDKIDEPEADVEAERAPPPAEQAAADQPTELADADAGQGPEGLERRMNALEQRLNVLTQRLIQALQKLETKIPGDGQAKPDK